MVQDARRSGGCGEGRVKRYDPYFNRAHAINPCGNPAFDAGLKALCAQLGISRPVLVTGLLDRELAARGLLGAAPCYRSMLGWPEGVTTEPCGCTPLCGACGTYVGTMTGGKR